MAMPQQAGCHLLTSRVNNIGVGCVAAHAYGACNCQAFGFSAIDTVVSSILKYLISSYIQDTRQFALATIAIKVVSGLAGVLTTRLIAEKTIGWKQAVASSSLSMIATTWTLQIFFPKQKIA